MKFREKIVNGILYVKVKPGYFDKFDLNELDMFNENLPGGFLQLVEIKDSYLRFAGPEVKSLSSFLKKPINKKTFFIIALKSLNAMESLQTAHFRIKNTCIELDHVYINVPTKEIYFLYIPCKDDNDNDGIKDFFNRFIREFIPDINEKDREYGVRFLDYINNKGRLTFRDLKQYIKSEETTLNMEFNLPKGCKIENGTDILEINITERGSVNTFVMEGDKDYSFGYPVLINTTTGDKYIISKPVFRIGKEKNYVDCFIRNNPAVSRNHADLIRRNNEFFIKDLNSTNFTFLNNIKLQPEKEVKINRGDIIRFGNEEFRFEE